MPAVVGHGSKFNHTSQFNEVLASCQKPSTRNEINMSTLKNLAGAGF